MLLRQSLPTKGIAMLMMTVTGSQLVFELVFEYEETVLIRA